MLSRVLSLARVMMEILSLYVDTFQGEFAIKFAITCTNLGVPVVS